MMINYVFNSNHENIYIKRLDLRKKWKEEDQEKKPRKQEKLEYEIKSVGKQIAFLL